LKLLSAKQAIIDGEIAALDQQGRASFQLLQSYGKAKKTPLLYYAFDLLFLEGTDLRARPLVERRKLLASVLKKAPPNIRFSEELRGTKQELLQLAQKFHLEGLIAKRPDSLYEAGRRSGAWVKVKLVQQQEFVIGGYTPPEGSTSVLCLLVTMVQAAFYSPAESVLVSRKEPWRLCMRASKRLKARIALLLNLPEQRPGRWGQGVKFGNRF
jgi:bifunctional non-homologous end joining protein LigD